MKKYLLLLIVMLCIMPIECYAYVSIDNDFLIGGLFILVAVALVYNNKGRKNGKHEISDISKEFGYSKDELKSILLNNFILLYDSINKKDLNTIKKICSSELYDSYYSQFESLDFLERKKVIDQFNLISFSIVEVSREKKMMYVKVDASVSYYQYVIDNEGRLIRGRKDILVKKNLDLVFVKKNIDFDSIKKCPHCLVNSKINAKGECINCGKKVVNYKDDFILLKKKSK